MLDSLVFRSLLLSDRDRETLAAWHESLTSVFEQEVQTAAQSKSSDELHEAVVQIGTSLMLRSLSGFITTLHRMCIDQVSIKNVLSWYSEKLTETAHGVWFKQATAKFGLRPIIRSPNTDVRLLLSHAKNYFPLPIAREAPAVTVVDTKRWHKNNTLIVRHLGIIAALSGEARRAAICNMAAALFDDIAEDRVRLVRSYNDVPDFEAELKTYAAFAVSPAMINLHLTESEIQSRGIAIEGRMRHWLGHAYSLLEAPDIPKLVSGDSLLGGKRKRGFPADQQRHELINKIVLSFGDSWKEHLSEICAELESARLSIPKTWRKNREVRNWNEVAEDFLIRGASEKRSLLVKALEGSTKWVRARKFT